MKYDLFYESRGAGRIHGCRWEPQGQPKAVLQLVHGIAEHIGRFEPLIRFFNDQGYVVVAEDHMGHGRSIGEECPQGYFHGGWFTAVEDTRQLMRYTMKKYPGLPYVLLGISMGSFMVRTLIAKYPDCGISAAILCGTAWQDPKVLKAGRSLARMVCKASDEREPSGLLQKMMFGSYNQRVKDPQSPNAWLCSDAAVVDNYDGDPLCGFQPTAGLARDMLEGIHYIQQPDTLCRMRKDLPVFFIAGDQDPVGNYGAGVERCAKEFRAQGMTRVALKLYPGCRHDVLNELDCGKIRADVTEWIESTID
ncbi:MAG: lysophospholipase [Oscillospiraceae bacterium]|nr:lysophospholipase [Oscillospiraceae bacterium]